MQNVDVTKMLFTLLRKHDPRVRYSPYFRVLPMGLTKNILEVILINVDIQYYLNLEGHYNLYKFSRMFLEK